MGEVGWGRGMGRRAGQWDGKKEDRMGDGNKKGGAGDGTREGGVEGWEEGGRGSRFLHMVL